MSNTNDRLPDLVKSEAKKFNSESNLNYSNIPQLIPVKDCKTDQEFTSGIKQTTRFRIVEDVRYSELLERVTTDFKVERLHGAEWEHVGSFRDMDGAKACIDLHKTFTAKTRVIMVVEIEEPD